MRLRPMRTIGACLMFAVAASLTSPAKAETPVDLELVLAVDISLSMDEDEQRLQREGYVNALRDPEVHRAIQSGQYGRIALTYMEWAGSHLQSVVVPWQVVGSPDEAAEFADKLAAEPLRREGMTSITRAIRTAASLFDRNSFAGTRRVIDVSGDGPNNAGGAVDVARDETVAQGIQINGLAIQIKRGMGIYSFFDLPDLDKYYAACVIGGDGAFMLPIKTKAEFATAIRQKLLLEIAGLQPPEVPEQHLQKAQFQLSVPKPHYDCQIGEKMWRRYMQDRWE